MTRTGSTTSPRRDVVAFLAHHWSEAAARRFARLRAEVAAVADCVLLLHDDTGTVGAAWRESLRAAGAEYALTTFTTAGLQARLGYRLFTDKQIVPGSAHFPLLALARHSAYRYYWLVESDVEYSGNWGELFAAFAGCRADLLGSHIEQRHAFPRWEWWESLQPPAAVDGLPDDALCKAFLPLYRVSGPALDIVDTAHRQGWRGHFEVLLPSILRRHGRLIQDLRSVIDCYAGDRQNPHRDLERQATVRWRPEIHPDEFRRRGALPTLFHPVKQDWWFDGETIVVASA